MMSRLNRQWEGGTPRWEDSFAIDRKSRIGGDSFTIGIARVTETGEVRNGAAADMFSCPEHVRKKRLPVGDGSQSKDGLLS